MIRIGDSIVSFDVFEECFCCDIQECKGACCVHGDAGAPLEEKEIKILEDIYSDIKPYMTDKGIEAIEKHGVSVTDRDGERVTPLVNGQECAFVYFEDGTALCAIEKACRDGVVSFMKPISCYLYPVRIDKYQGYEAVNYHRWGICKSAVCQGRKQKLPVYAFLREPLIRKYGKDWYKELSIAAQELRKEGIIQ